MKGIITHEASQEVTLAFNRRGHDFKSCDIVDCYGGDNANHYKESVETLLPRIVHTLDFLGMHPVCQYLTNSGVRWLASKKPKDGFTWSEKYQIYINWVRYRQMESAAINFKWCLEQVNKVGSGYVENPIMHKYAMEIIQEKPTQIIQPWQFGHGETKATCLWVIGLPKLEPTDIVDGREQKIWKMPPSPDRTKLRSKTYPGIAKAMAEQWGS